MFIYSGEENKTADQTGVPYPVQKREQLNTKSEGKVTGESGNEAQVEEESGAGNFEGSVGEHSCGWVCGSPVLLRRSKV